jgi:hypothetical protein
MMECQGLCLRETKAFTKANAEKTPGSKKKTKGGVAPSGYTTSIGVGGMSFDHKMS